VDLFWIRLLGLTLGLLALLGLLSFVVALRAYPHQVTDGVMTIHYGACFELPIPLELVASVTRRKALITQKRTAEIRDGVLSLPVMGVTNLVVTLGSPIKVRVRKSAVVEVRERPYRSGTTLSRLAKSPMVAVPISPVAYVPMTMRGQKMPGFKKLLLGDHEDPSLELERLFGNGATGQIALNAAVTWGREVLDSKGVSAQDGVLAIRALRQAERQLSLVPAVHLAKLLAQ